MQSIVVRSYPWGGCCDVSHTRCQNGYKVATSLSQLVAQMCPPPRLKTLRTVQI